MGETCPARHVSNCTCSLEQMWEGLYGFVKVYPNLKLMTFGRLLFRIPNWFFWAIFGKHRLLATTRFSLCRLDDYEDYYLELTMYGNNWRSFGFFKEIDAVGAGLWRVRAIQRCWRHRVTVIWQERALAVAMGLHKRLGAESEMRHIDNELVRFFL